MVLIKQKVIKCTDCGFEEECLDSEEDFDTIFNLDICPKCKSPYWNLKKMSKL